MEAEVVLVEYEDKKNSDLYGGSGIMIDENYVLITSNILTSLLEEDHMKLKLKSLTPGILNCNTFQSVKVNVLRRNKQNSELLIFEKASILAAFLCPNLRKCCKILKDFAVDTSSNQNDLTYILPLFFILNIHERGSPVDLKNMLKKWFYLTLNEKLQTGDYVFAKSVPFGNRNFLNSYSAGVVSKIIGESGCLVLSDCPSTPGSEGSPFYKANSSGLDDKYPLGIVISSLSWWRGEWIGLTLVADIRSLIFQIQDLNITDTIQNNNNQVSVQCYKVIGILESSLAQVYCGLSSWGTAILIDKKKGVFVTNSHVLLQDDNDPIQIFWKGESSKCSLIYRTPDNSVYDIALIKCNPNEEMLKKMQSIAFSLVTPKVGDEVYAAGYSLLQKEKTSSPFLSEGQISQYNSWMLKTTCFVHAGSSGGPVLDKNGDLIGIIVCNVKSQDTGVVYPRFNMAIPVTAVVGVVKQFLDNNDARVLEKLCVRSGHGKKFWQNLEAKL